MVLPVLVMHLISNFLPNTKHSNTENNDESDDNIYELVGKKIRYYAIPLLYICFILITIMRDYSLVKSKYLIDNKSISLFKISFYIGLIGLLITILIFILISFFPCKSFNNVIKEGNKYLIGNNSINFSKEICRLKDYDDNKKILKLYYDNIFLLINSYKIFDKEVKKELFITLPLYIITVNSHDIFIKFWQLVYKIGI